MAIAMRMDHKCVATCSFFGDKHLCYKASTDLYLPWNPSSTYFSTKYQMSGGTLRILLQAAGNKGLIPYHDLNACNITCWDI
jgi:hypothetical protein